MEGGDPAEREFPRGRVSEGTRGSYLVRSGNAVRPLHLRLRETTWNMAVGPPLLPLPYLTLPLLFSTPTSPSTPVPSSAFQRQTLGVHLPRQHAVISNLADEALWSVWLWSDRAFGVLRVVMEFWQCVVEWKLLKRNLPRLLISIEPWSTPFVPIWYTSYRETTSKQALKSLKPQISTVWLGS